MPFVGVRNVVNLLVLVDDLVRIVIGLQERNCPSALHLLIDLVIVDRAAAAHDAEDRDHVAQAERRHLTGAGEKPGVAEDRDRAHAYNAGASTDRHRFYYAIEL